MSAASSPKDTSLVECLRDHPYFSELDPHDLAELAQQAVRRTFAPGEVIFLEGDPSAGLWIIESGHVKIFKLNVDGREHILHMFGPGESFNDISALDGNPNPANAAAMTDMTAWVFSPESLLAAFVRYPALALAIVRRVSGLVRMLVRQLEDLALYSVPVRLARFLLQEYEDDTPDRPGITRADMAAHLATTPETVSRGLRALEDAGAIQFDRHRILITDEELLRTIALL